MLSLKIRFIEPFKDGRILPRAYKAAETVIIPEWQAGQIKQSGGVFEVVEKIIPPPVDENGKEIERPKKA